MKIILLISILMLLNLSAKNLSQILNKLESSAKAKAIIERSRSDIAENENSFSYEAPILGASLSHADSTESYGEDGTEYGINFSQNLNYPFSSVQKNTSVSEYSKAINQELKHELHLLNLDTVSLYHEACISKEIHNKSALLYQDQTQRFEQIQTAYKLGEISRKDLLFNKLDLVKLQQNVSAYKREYLFDLATLQTNIDNVKINTIDCTDMLKPSQNIILNNIEEHGELQAINYKKNSAKASYNIHDSILSSLSYELAYEKELDMQKYTVGVSIPLDDLSTQKEKSKAQQFALSSAYEHEHTAVRLKVQNYSKSALIKLKVLYSEYILLKEEVLPVNTELVTLSKLALLEGESDVMEYIDATRSYSLNLLEMLEIKKRYYRELFELYKIADLEFGEKNENIN